MRILVLLLGLVLGMGSIAGALTVQELDASGLDHFGKAFYEATPQKDQEKAAAEYGLAEAAFKEAIQAQPDYVEPTFTWAAPILSRRSTCWRLKFIGRL